MRIEWMFLFGLLLGTVGAAFFSLAGEDGGSTPLELIGSGFLIGALEAARNSGKREVRRDETNR